MSNGNNQNQIPASDFINAVVVDNDGWKNLPNWKIYELGIQKYGDQYDVAPLPDDWKKPNRSFSPNDGRLLQSEQAAKGKVFSKLTPDQYNNLPEGSEPRLIPQTGTPKYVINNEDGQPIKRS